MNAPREWWVYVYPEEPGGGQLMTGEQAAFGAESPSYPRQRVRLIEWPADAPLPALVADDS